MDKVPIGIGEHRIGGGPFDAKLIQHRAGIVDSVGPRLRGFPNIDVRGLQGDEIVEFRSVHQIDPRQNAQCPINGLIAIPKRVVREVVDVEANFHALRNQ